MGKVKKKPKSQASQPVSIPNGKGKATQLTMSAWKECQVSIPNGKGKAEIADKIIADFVTYQFPMGKVKFMLMREKALKARYQFPMGKVKNNILCYVLIIHTIYRFVNKKFYEF